MQKQKIRQIILEETYKDVSLLLYHVTHKVATTYNTPFEDLISVARLAYVQAVDSYSNNHGTKLSSWIYSNVFWKLVTHARKETRHKSEEVEGEEILDYLPCKRSEAEASTCFFDLVAELGLDARRVVRLVTAEHGDFAQLCRLGKKGRSKTDMQRRLRVLLLEMGWTAEDISGAFRQIRRKVRNSVKGYDETWLIEHIGLSPRQVRTMTRKARWC